MSLKAYLTIDDTPSSHTDSLTDFLAAHDIPSLIFCRGDLMQENLSPVVRAIDKGQIIANHNYSHTAAGDLSYEEIVEEIEKTEALIDQAYAQSGQARPGKYFRFPYLDKGDGDRLERRFGEIIDKANTVDLSGNEKVQKLQDWLRGEGFTQPFKNVTHPLYQNRDVADAADCLFTYSSCDWMMTARHKGRWDYQTTEDLMAKIDDDPYLCKGGGAQVTLFHDQPEIDDVVKTLISYMIDKGFEFLRPE